MHFLAFLTYIHDNSSAATHTITAFEGGSVLQHLIPLEQQKENGKKGKIP